jgi:UDP-glucose 4-epimerase
MSMMDNKKVVGEVINIGPDEEFISINKLAEICSNISGSNLKPEYFPDRPLEVKLAICSSDKARKLLNYKTTTNTYDAIKKTYEYIKSRGPKKFDYNINIEINNDLTPETWKKKLF